MEARYHRYMKSVLIRGYLLRLRTPACSDPLSYPGCVPRGAILRSERGVGGRGRVASSLELLRSCGPSALQATRVRGTAPGHENGGLHQPWPAWAPSPPFLSPAASGPSHLDSGKGSWCLRSPAPMPTAPQSGYHGAVGSCGPAGALRRENRVWTSQNRLRVQPYSAQSVIQLDQKQQKSTPLASCVQWEGY